MDWITSIAYETWLLYLEMAPYLLFGFLLAGFLHSLFPEEKIVRHLGHRSFGSVLKAAVAGVPLPLCSCGVIPMALSLRRQGAGKGATLSFLSSTPQTGVDSIAATYGMMGPVMGILRPILSFITGVLTGLTYNLFSRNEPDDANTPFSPSAAGTSSKKSWLGESLHYGMVEHLAGIYRWLVIGIVLAGIVTVFLPDSLFTTQIDSPLAQMLLMIVAGIPLYICATGSIPVAVGFMLKGLSPGAAFVFLMVGPATNVATITMVARYLGRKAVLLYVTSLCLISIAGGYVVNWTYAWLTIDPISHMHDHMHVSPLWWWITMISAAALGGCMLWAALTDLRNFIRSRRPAAEPAPAANGHSADLLTLGIEGMTCAHCQGTVQKTLSGFPGVSDVVVDLPGKRATFAYAGGPPPLDDITTAVRNAGFEVTN